MAIASFGVAERHSITAASTTFRLQSDNTAMTLYSETQP